MTNDVPSRRKPISPTAPGLSLSTAVSEVARVYSRYSHGTFSKGELASALGMSASSGTFLSKAAALRDYGLIEDGPTGERVSDLFKSLYQAPPRSAEAKRVATTALTRSSVFSKLLQQFPSRVPDESAIALRLETQERFNADRAKVVAAAFRRSLADFELIDASGNVLSIRDDGPASTSEANQGERTVAETSGLFRVEVPLGAGRRAVFMLPEDFSAADSKRVTAVLRAYVDADAEP